MKDLFKAISDAITANVAAVRWVDFDLGQLEQETPPVSFPCALIGFQSATFENIAGTGQQADILVSVRLAFRVFERTHSKATSNFRNEGLAHLDTIQAVHNALNGLDGDNFSALIRSGYENEKRADLRVYNLFYTVSYCDVPQSAYTDWETASGGANLDFCVNEDLIDP